MRPLARLSTKFLIQALLLGSTPVLATRAYAVDGVIEINAARATAGGVTASDQPGFPVTIDAPGSYRLTSNLTVGGDPAPSAIVVITAQNVTIDLNGFTIQGPTNCTGIPVTNCEPAGNAMGIDASARQAVTIRDGIIRGFPDRGLMTGPRAVVDGVVVSSNGGNGIQVGNGSIVRNCRASQNGNDGIAGGAVVVFEADTADSNGSVGVRTSLSSVIANCTASSNGTDGFVFFAGSNLRGNAANLNKSDGYSGSGASILSGNTATSNEAFGFSIGSGSGYTHCVLTGNNDGDANAQVTGGVDLGANVCGLPAFGNGIVCP